MERASERPVGLGAGTYVAGRCRGGRRPTSTTTTTIRLSVRSPGNDQKDQNGQKRNMVGSISIFRDIGAQFTKRIANGERLSRPSPTTRLDSLFATHHSP